MISFTESGIEREGRSRGRQQRVAIGVGFRHRGRCRSHRWRRGAHRPRWDGQAPWTIPRRPSRDDVGAAAGAGTARSSSSVYRDRVCAPALPRLRLSAPQLRPGHRTASSEHVIPSPWVRPVFGVVSSESVRSLRRGCRLRWTSRRERHAHLSPSTTLTGNVRIVELLRREALAGHDVEFEPVPRAGHDLAASAPVEFPPVEALHLHHAAGRLAWRAVRIDAGRHSARHEARRRH